MHTGLLLAMGGTRRCGLTDVLGFACTAWVTTSWTANGLDGYGRSCRGITQAVKCEGEERSVRRDFCWQREAV